MKDVSQGWYTTKQLLLIYEIISYLVIPMQIFGMKQFRLKLERVYVLSAGLKLIDTE